MVGQSYLPGVRGGTTTVGGTHGRGVALAYLVGGVFLFLRFFLEEALPLGVHPQPDLPGREHAADRADRDPDLRPAQRGHGGLRAAGRGYQLVSLSTSFRK